MNFTTGLARIALATSICVGAFAQTPKATGDQATTTSRQTATTSQTSTTSMVGEDDKRFITEAAMGGMAEVQMAQLAQQKASSDGVKQYAQRLEKDHTAANTELKKIAEQKNVSVPSDMGPKHQAHMQKMQGMSGEQFDKAYIKMMVQDHKKDIREFTKESNQGMDSDVKAFASKTLPTLQSHLTDVQQLASNKTTNSATSK